MSKPNPATIAAQAAHSIDAATGGVVPPIQPSTTFARDRDYDLLNREYSYARYHNGAARIAETVLTQLEAGADAALFPSGMAAIAALFRTIPYGGSAIIQQGIYHGTSTWIRNYCQRQSITLHEIDTSDTDALRRLCGATSADILFVETPSNPWLKITDIAAAKTAATDAGALLVVDSTAATPILSQPISLGADVVMHSSTKAINGHSDVLSGALITAENSAFWQGIKTERDNAGTVIGPFEAWLLVRGMRTLPLRVHAMCSNAMKIAAFLADHPAVEKLRYPGLADFDGHATATRQMTGGFGYLMSVQVRGDAATALGVAGKLNLFHRATSLGGVESLVEHRHTIEPDSGIPPNLLRLSIGIEHADDLIQDLGQALGQ